MENKHRIIVICMVFVVIGGMLFDLSHRANKFEQQKQQKKEVSADSFAQKLALHENAVPKNDTSELEFQVMAMGARKNAQSSSEQKQPEQPKDVKTVSEELPKMEPVRNQYRKASGKKAQFFAENGISINLSSIPAKYKTHDASGVYYFLPATKGQNILGVIVKVNAKNTLLWVKAIKYERMVKPNVRILTFVSKNLKLYFSQRNGIGALPINFAPDGTVLKNPYAPVYATNLDPADYEFKIVKPFTYKNSDFVIASFINKKPSPDVDFALEEFYIYKLNGSNLVKHFLLFDRKVPLKVSRIQEPEFDVSFDSKYLAIDAASPASDMSSGYNKSVRYGIEVLTLNLKPPETLAPNMVSSGISVIEIGK